MWQRLKQWWARRFQRPTPARELLPVLTRVVALPVLSRIAGRRVRVRIRVVSEPLVSAVFDGPCKGMSQEEAHAYMKKLPAEEFRKANERAEVAIETLLRAAVLDPSLAPAEGPAPPGAIPYEALRPDHFLLVKEIVELTGTFGLCSTQAILAEAGKATEMQAAPRTVAAGARSSSQ